MPFLVSWPLKIKAGQVTEHLSAFWDVKATLADLTDVPLSKATDGISFLPTILGKKVQAEHDYLYWEFNEADGPHQALLKGFWKLIYKVEKDRYELYNLNVDPSENENVIDQDIDAAKELKTKLLFARTEHPEFPLTRRPNPWDKNK